MVLSHRITTTTQAAPTAVLPHSDSAIVIIGTGAGTAGSGDLAAFNTPTAVTTLAQATTAFGAGSIVDAVEHIESIVDVTCYCIRYNETLSGGALTTAINGAIDAVSRAGVGTRVQPHLCIAHPDIVRNTTPNGAANAFVTRLKGVCDLRDIALILDGDVATASPLTVAATYNTNNGAAGVAVAYGPLLVDTAHEDNLPYSVEEAARVAWQDQEVGIQVWPSNVPLPQVTNITPALSTGRGSDVSTLDAANVHGATLDPARGIYRNFGNASHTAEATDPLRFLGFWRVTRRIGQILNTEANLHIDRGITSDLEERIAFRMNQHLLIEASRGLIRSGVFTPSVVADPVAHTLYFNMEIQGIEPLQYINITRQFFLGGE